MIIQLRLCASFGAQLEDSNLMKQIAFNLIYVNAWRSWPVSFIYHLPIGNCRLPPANPAKFHLFKYLPICASSEQFVGNDTINKCMRTRETVELERKRSSASRFTLLPHEASTTRCFVLDDSLKSSHLANYRPIEDVLSLLSFSL